MNLELFIARRIAHNGSGNRPGVMVRIAVIAVALSVMVMILALAVIIDLRIRVGRHLFFTILNFNTALIQPGLDLCKV